MEIFAYYLPQFHQIPENDEWWGEGFTEWTNCQNAKPLFKGHNQPQRPLDENYYDLLNYDTVKWQVNLAKAYGIDGFVYYHYYFQGDMLLEKPAENFLKWKDLQHSFYFCWANHSWYKSIDGCKKLLKEQTYGNQNDWENHFRYLLPFFKDSRYKKIGNKPVFMCFLPHFKEKRKMLNKFNEWCMNAGFNGLYYIEGTMLMVPSKFIFHKKTDAFVLREFNHSKYIFDYLNFKKKVSYYSINNSEKKIAVYNGNDFFDIMIKNFIQYKKIIHTVCFEWDNTPRHKENGYIVTPPDKDKVFQYLNLLKDEKMLIVNAWNEWAEGMVLEPTEQKGYRYLEWLKEWKNTNEIISN